MAKHCRCGGRFRRVHETEAAAWWVCTRCHRVVSQAKRMSAAAKQRYNDRQLRLFKEVEISAMR